MQNVQISKTLPMRNSFSRASRRGNSAVIDSIRGTGGSRNAFRASRAEYRLVGLPTRHDLLLFLCAICLQHPPQFDESTISGPTGHSFRRKWHIINDIWMNRNMRRCWLLTLAYVLANVVLTTRALRCVNCKGCSKFEESQTVSCPLNSTRCLVRHFTHFLRIFSRYTVNHQLCVYLWNPSLGFYMCSDFLLDIFRLFTLWALRWGPFTHTAITLRLDSPLNHFKRLWSTKFAEIRAKRPSNNV